MWPDRVSNSGPLTYESDALPIALRGPACQGEVDAVKRGPKLNLIKKWRKGGGGGVNPTTPTVSSLVSEV